ncbi:aminopeptidase N-like isoform X2 [Rhodnius prolixus]
MKLKARSDYTLSFLFSGKILDNQEGIFKHQAHGRTYISTNLFPFSARKAFPCFNDAFEKSSIVLTIATKSAPNGIRALSNMPLAYKNDQNTLFYFKPTPKIPLHNLFFTLGYYQRSQFNENLFVPINSIKFNKEFSFVLDNHEVKNFQQIAKLAKVQIVAVPGLARDSITGYGIVAISENNLFLDLLKVTTNQRKVALLNAFSAFFKLFYGSCLTPKSWSDSWIVESIPIYLKYRGLAEIDSWKDPYDFISHDIQQKLLLSNSDPSAGPIVDRSLKTEVQVLNFLEGPAMLKGAGVLFMLESVLTKEVMSQVLADFFSKSISEESAVSTEDFVNFFVTHKEVVEKIHNKLNLKEVLLGWLSQSGFPYLQTKRAGSGITIDEKVFTGGIRRTQEKLWKFPIFYANSNDPAFFNVDKFFWLLLDDPRTVSLNFTVPPDDWFVLNVNGTGPYRVNYEEKDWLNLALVFANNHTIFPTSTRSKLISDAFAMIYAGHANPYIIFSFLTYLQKEESLTPWLSALDGFEYLHSLIYSIGLKDDLDTYMQNILNEIYKELGIDNNSVDNFQGILRQRIVSAVCNHGNQACITDTTKDYLKMIDVHSGYSPNNDVRPVILCNGIRGVRDAQKWSGLYNTTFDDTSDMGHDIRKVYYEALACPTSEDGTENEGINQFLNYIFRADNYVIPKADVPTAFKAIYTNPDHVTQALHYFVINEQRLRKDISLSEKVRLLRGIVPYLTKTEELKLLQKYLDVVKPKNEMRDAVMLAMLSVNRTQNFLNNNYKALKSAFQQVNPPTPAPPTVTPPAPTLTTKPSNVTTPPTVPPNGTVTTPTTPKPNSAAELNIFSLFTLLMVYLAFIYIA